jgi:phage FluMu gp28-like protein
VTESAFAVLLPYQGTIPALVRKYSILIYEKSRRIGLSYGVSPFAVIAAAFGYPATDDLPALPAQNVYYIGYNLDMAREFITYGADFAKAFDSVVVSLPPETATLEGWQVNAAGDGVEFVQGDVVADEAEGVFLFKDGSTKGLKTLRIDFPNGKSIAALPSTPRAVRGKQGIFIIDEAAFHDDLEGLIKAVLAALMWGGSVIIISTHDGDENYFNELINEIRSGKRSGHVERITINDALAQGLYKRICQVSGREWTAAAEGKWLADLELAYGDAAAEELYVIPSRGSGTYMARATIEAACSKLYPVIRLTCPKGHELADLEWRDSWIAEWLAETIVPLIAKMDPGKLSYFGDDFARNNDLSVMAVGQYDDMATLIVPFIIEMRNVPFREQKAVRSFVIEHLPIFAKANMDGRGNGQQMAEELGDDFGHDRIEAIKATQATYLTGFPRLKGRIEDRTILIPWAEGVIDDLRLIKLVRGVPMVVDRSDDKVDGDKAKRHGDSAIALMNLVCAADADFGPFDFESAGPRSGSTPQADVTNSGFGTVRRASTDAFQTMDGSGF